jgi:hypothetical protein
MAGRLGTTREKPVELADVRLSMATAAHPDPTPPATLQRYARVAGVAMLLSIVFGALGEAYIPGLIVVRNDAAATAANVLQNPGLVRAGFATYLVEGICDVALCVIFYILLKPVDRNLALLSAFFGMASMITFAVAESSYFASLLLVRDTAGMNAFSVDQRNALAMLAFRISTMIGALFLIMYGLATMLRGYLIARSGYLPKTLGVLFMIGGLGFVLRTITYVVYPPLSSQVLLMPMAVAGIPLTLWLLIRGVKVTPEAIHPAR